MFGQPQNEPPVSFSSNQTIEKGKTRKEGSGDLDSVYRQSKAKPGKPESSVQEMATHYCQGESGLWVGSND